ncbi:hypothetical protein [Foetidibacter luteolus]|uniref:hypothetical protein n=1 Tax=Foetidibacter luteolus TaxID=2608880 RepID=UPI00129AD5A4|nr:hypothetical protein [Foetidibacter luteolus]
MSAALFFAWWKSSLSQPAINFFNYKLQFPVNRVVDYTDYMALTVLPMVYKLRHEGCMNFVHKLAAVVVAGVSLFAFCATTCRGYYPSRMSTEVYMYNSYKTTLTENQVFKRLDSLKLRYKKDSVKANEIYTYDSIFYLQKDSVTGITNRVVLPTKNTVVYARYKTSPFIEVYNVPAENEMIPVVTFGYFARKGKSRIEISSITLDSLQYSRYVKEPALERRYKKMLENLLIKQLQ